MVVNKKQSLSQAPGMGSRTSSSQPLSRNKPTTNAKNVPSVAGPSITKKASKAAKRVGKAKKESGSWTDRLMVLFLTIFTAYALWTCPSDERLANPICRSLSQYRTHVLDPYVMPPINSALSHPSIAPVVSKIYAAERAITPVVVRTHTIAQPYISKSTKLTKTVVNHTYKRLLRPQYEKYVMPQYRKHIAPHVEQFHDRVVEPYLTPVVVNTHLYTNKAFVYAHRFYTTVQPHVRTVYVRVRPYAQRAWKVLKPYLGRAAENGQALLTVLVDKIGQMRRLYVDPHVLRIWDKVVELSGPVRSTGVPAGETKASSAAPTKSLWSSTVAVVSTSSSPSPSATQEPETEPAVPEETLSVVEPEETVVEAEAIVEKSLSPSSVVVETITPSASVESAPAEEPPVESAEEPAEEPSPVSNEETVGEVRATTSVIAESVSPSAPIDSPQKESLPEKVDGTTDEEPFSEEEELLSFFDDLGISPDEIPAEEPEPVPEVNVMVDKVEEPSNLSPEEALASAIAAATERDRLAREARKEETTKKREDITNRHRRWAYGLDELIHRRMRELRKELVRIRKNAVKVLGLSDSKMQGDGDAKEGSELEEELTHIDGQPVADLLEWVEGEGDKLLKGLESYLKKEQKDVGITKPESGAEDRLKKWMNISEKVRSKFGEKVREMQEKVHRWYRGVRDMEVHECVAAATEVKSYAEGAQADLGMDYAWLDDVTYLDWQKYHDLMKEFYRFEQEIQLVQNGSHINPVIDPLIPALDKLQIELDDLVNGFEARTRLLGMKIREVLFGPDEEEISEVEPVDKAKQPESEEQVSILPIVPMPSAPEGSEKEPGFDASNVIIGKGKEQVEEALKGVSLEPIASQVHEEL